MYLKPAHIPEGKEAKTQQSPHSVVTVSSGTKTLSLPPGAQDCKVLLAMLAPTASWGACWSPDCCWNLEYNVQMRRMFTLQQM